MALNSTNRKNLGKNIQYLNKDFGEFRNNLIEYAKTYFPTTYSDFNESSPGMMFIEMASYLGDVLGYYIDDTLKESMIHTAEDKDNVVALANFLGYKPKVTSPALTKVAVYQLTPSKRKASGNLYEGDNRFEMDEGYLLRIKEGMELTSDTGVIFRTTELVDFNDEFEREVSVYERNALQEPTFYLIRKFVNAISAEEKEVNIQFGSPKQFDKIELADTNIIQIYDVRDSNGNKWYEVPYLAQEMVYTDYPNTSQFDGDLAQFKDSVPSILRVTKTSRRFVRQVNPNNTTSIVFGAGNSTSSDETFLPNFKNVGLGLNNSIDRLGASFDPANFLKSKSYGQAPSNTTLSVRYLVGGGVEANVSKASIKRITKMEFDEDLSLFDDDELQMYGTVKNSIAAENEIPASGGRGSETIDEIRENALAHFGSQNRAVTRKDYQVRALALPPKFGGVAKAFCAPDGELDNNSPSSILNNPDSLEEFAGLVEKLNTGDKKTETEIKTELQRFLVGKTGQEEKNNPFAINLYLLGYNSSKNLTSLNKAVKENVKTYLSEFRLLTDGINLLDGFVINIGVDFEIMVYNSYNKREVMLKCITEIEKYFNIDDWAFNQPINISELELVIAGVEGVLSVPKCEIVNKCGGVYSKHKYNISNATKGKMVYPSLDPCVFELKYPGKDIKGRVV
tara:strand:+ start:3032 stop:5068 length:2037 start_codon:yes stop_codon:yes gene_type:complete